MYGDPKKKCCACENGADIREGSKYYCCDHYALYVLRKPMSQIEKELNKELNYDMDI